MSSLIMASGLSGHILLFSMSSSVVKIMSARRRPWHNAKQSSGENRMALWILLNAASPRDALWTLASVAPKHTWCHRSTLCLTAFCIAPSFGRQASGERVHVIGEVLAHVVTLKMHHSNNTPLMFKHCTTSAFKPSRGHRKSIHDVMRSGTVDVGDGVIVVIQVKDIAHECIAVIGSGVPAAGLKCGLWAPMDGR